MVVGSVTSTLRKLHFETVTVIFGKNYFLDHVRDKFYVKDTLKAFDDFKNKQKKCMK